MSRLCRAARDERSLRFTGAIAGTLNLLPPGVVGGMLKHIDFVASDIPGFPFPGVSRRRDRSNGTSPSVRRPAPR